MFSLVEIPRLINTKSVENTLLEILNITCVGAGGLCKASFIVCLCGLEIQHDSHQACVPMTLVEL